jgi:hypothetical protein
LLCFLFFCAGGNFGAGRGFGAAATAAFAFAVNAACAAARGDVRSSCDVEGELLLAAPMMMMMISLRLPPVAVLPMLRRLPPVISVLPINQQLLIFLVLPLQTLLAQPSTPYVLLQSSLVHSCLRPTAFVFIFPASSLLQHRTSSSTIITAIGFYNDLIMFL